MSRTKHNAREAAVGLVKAKPATVVHDVLPLPHDSDFLSLFLHLTSHTYPHGTEKAFLPFLRDWTDGYDVHWDSSGFYTYIPGEHGTTSMFTCHLDTACASYAPVTHEMQGNFIGTDGSTILGADDKAGVVVLLHMIRSEVPGLYAFFYGEECGGIGSSQAAEKESINGFPAWSTFRRCVAFDRRRYGSIITHQSGGRCCSNVFSEALARELFERGGLFLDSDDGGTFTDTANFMEHIAECTNVSIGYFNEHTKYETLNVRFMECMAEAAARVDWESLPTVRDPEEYSSYGRYTNGRYSSSRSATDDYKSYNVRYDEFGVDINAKASMQSAVIKSVFDEYEDEDEDDYNREQPSFSVDYSELRAISNGYSDRGLGVRSETHHDVPMQDLYCSIDDPCNLPGLAELTTEWKYRFIRLAFAWASQKQLKAVFSHFENGELRSLTKAIVKWMEGEEEHLNRIISVYPFSSVRLYNSVRGVKEAYSSDMIPPSLHKREVQCG